jgi:two-component system, chemotaxis family, chemotaxis protein CheY
MIALVVDDSAAARQTALAALEEAADELDADLQIRVASGGVEALRVLASDDVDVLLVDLHMPDLHGLEVLSFWAQRKGARAAIALVISTEVAKLDKSRAFALGAHAFIEKPVSKDAVVAALGPFLRDGSTGGRAPC